MKLAALCGFFLLTALGGVTMSLADCNVCSSMTNTACVSDTQFQTCIGNFPSGPINSCPNGYVCTADVQICQPNSLNVARACSGCNQCDATNTFACTGARTFALCLGTGAISDITGNCAPYHVCNVNYPQICGNATQGIAATCSFLDNTVTTTTPTFVGNYNATVYCRTIRQSGRFPYVINLATTCRQYIYCYMRNFFWYGQLYTCPGRTFFDSSFSKCVDYVPARCSWTVQNIQLRNLALD